jgi:hypothetical protein
MAFYGIRSDKHREVRRFHPRQSKILRAGNLPSMTNDIIIDLETSRSQIEGKFSRAGAVLESTITLISEQLDFLSQLNTVLDPKAVDEATGELTATSSELRALPVLLDGRGKQLRNIKHTGEELQTHLEEMRDILRYLLVFALNVKITAADNATDAQQFDIFVHEMRTRIENGEAELNDFETQLQGVIDQVRAALQLEAELTSKASAMLPAVPDHLSRDAGAIRDQQIRIAEMTSEVSALAQKIQFKIVNALSSLQIGDISRQRIEHVQNGIALMRGARASCEGEGYSPDACARLEQFLSRLLAAQLADTAEAFENDSRSMLKDMAGMAADAQGLLRVQHLQDASHGGSQGNLRSLEKSVADAIALVTEMEQAVSSADEIRQATVQTIEQLMGRVDALKSVKEDVQFMALNTTVSCSRMGDAGKPLQVIAVELRLYAKKLDTIADSTLQALRSLGQQVTDLGNGTSQTSAQSKLEGAATRLRAAADLAETGLAKIGEQAEIVVKSLSKAESELDFKAELGDVLHRVANSLEDAAGEAAIEVEDVANALQPILDEIGKSYTMSRERDVHAAFAIEPAATSRAA